ncbi:MAG: hypothetical protein WCS09_09845 [Pseudomonadota bacterium]|jgi:uncharacterized protein (DUF1810 family)
MKSIVSAKTASLWFICVVFQALVAAGLATLWLSEGRSLNDIQAMEADRLAGQRIQEITDSASKATAWGLEMRVASLLKFREENRRFIGYVFLISLGGLTVTILLLMMAFFFRQKPLISTDS